MALHHDITVSMLEAIGIINHDNVLGASIELVPDNFPRVTITMAITDKVFVGKIAEIVLKYRLAPSLEKPQ